MVLLTGDEGSDVDLLIAGALISTRFFRRGGLEFVDD
jgi:hypothetical protein